MRSNVSYDVKSFPSCGRPAVGPTPTLERAGQVLREAILKELRPYVTSGLPHRRDAGRDASHRFDGLPRVDAHDLETAYQQGVAHVRQCCVSAR